MRVLAFPKYGSLAASTRQRFMQFEPGLAEAGISVDYSPLLDNDHLRRLVKGRRASPFAVGRAYGSRAAKLLDAKSYDLLWLGYEFFPYLPGFIEAWSARIAATPFVLDYDDAIFHMYDRARSPIVRLALGKKLSPLMRRAALCICGNEYVRDYAAEFSDNTVVVPTVVDTDIYRPIRRTPERPVTVGWIGSPSTWNYVRPLLPVLARLCETRDVRVLVVGAGDAAENDRFPGLDLAEWSEEAEVELVQSMDIGIMPLTDDPWARGKSGYKLVQYLACGLPVVASPVGANANIVTEEAGFLATDLGDWQDRLEILIASADLRRRMGERGRERAVADYSLAAYGPVVVELLKSAGLGSASRR